MESIPKLAMFCEKCGTRIPDGQTQCPVCQVRTAAPAQQTGGYQQNSYQSSYQPNGYQGGYQPNGYQGGYQPNGYQGGYQPNGYQGGQPQRRPRKNRKKKSNLTGLLLVGGIAAALVIVILIAVFSGVFASNETRLAKMEKTNAKLISEALSSSYGDYLDSMEESLKKQQKGTGAEAQIKITANEVMLESILNPLIGDGYGNVDMAWLKNVVLNVDVDAKGKQMALSCGLGVNDKVLATVAGLVSESNMLCLGVPELNEKYIGMDLQDLDVDMDSLYAMQAPTQKLVEQMPSEKEVKKMLDQYLTVVFDYVEEVEKVKETVTVGDETKEVTVLRVRITAPQLMEMCIQLIEMAKEDETLRTMIYAVSEFVIASEVAMEGTSYTGIDDAYNGLIYELDSALADLKENKDSVGPENYILLSNYTVAGAIVGRKAEVYNDGMKEMDLGHYMFLPAGNGGVFEAAAEEVKITGTIDGKEMEFALEVENRNMMTIAIQDLSFDDSVLNGTIRLMPSRALLSEANGSALDALMIGSKDTYVQIKLDGTVAKGTTELSLVIGGNEMIGISAQVKETKFNKITEPVDAVMVQSEYDLMRWVSGIKFDKLTSNMTEAGVPDEYVQIVSQLASMMQMSGMLP